MAQLEKLLEESRRELLDLSTRNRLLAIPVESKSARVIHVRDEKSDVVSRLLVGERKAMGFLPGIEKMEASWKIANLLTGERSVRVDAVVEPRIYSLDEVGQINQMAILGRAEALIDTP
jgi:hypothetical protein